MRSPFLAFLACAFVEHAYAAGVTGSAEGFAKGVTGGGSATPVVSNSSSYFLLFWQILEEKGSPEDQYHAL